MIEMLTQEITLSDQEFRLISDLVYKYCGINLHTGKKELVRARLAKRLRALKLHTFSDYIAYATKDQKGSEFYTFIDSLSTNLTSFFREAQHFEYLNTEYFPVLLRNKEQKRDFRIRVWSAGCSSGEEPYTISIVLHEAVSGRGRWDLKVLATDISTRVLNVARQGLYEASRVAPVSAQLKQKYLSCQKHQGREHYQVNSLLKNTVVFARLNLMESWPIRGPLEFIFCRNVMIYFDKPTQERLVNRFYELLASGGLLFTGHSESLTGINHKFSYVQPTIYKKP